MLVTGVIPPQPGHFRFVVGWISTTKFMGTEGRGQVNRTVARPEDLRITATPCDRADIYGTPATNALFPGTTRVGVV